MLYSSHHIKDVFCDSLIIALLVVSLSCVRRCNNCCNTVFFLPLTLYLELRDNLEIDVENLCSSENSKVFKTTDKRLCNL